MAITEQEPRPSGPWLATLDAVLPNGERVSYSHICDSVEIALHRVVVEPAYAGEVAFRQVAISAKPDDGPLAGEFDVSGPDIGEYRVVKWRKAKQEARQ